MHSADHVDPGKANHSGVLRRMLADSVPWFLLYGVLAAVFLGLGATGLDVLDLFRDPAEISRLSLPPWEGSLSLLGYMTWIAAATACLLTAAAVRGERHSRRVGFLAATGTIALLLGLDDALLLHEFLADALPGRGRGGVMVLTPYAAAGLVWAIRYRREILASRLGPVLASGVGFGGSFALEFWPATAQLPQADLLEEILELGGLLMFAVYCVLESYRDLVPSPR